MDNRARKRSFDEGFGEGEPFGQLGYIDRSLHNYGDVIGLYLNVLDPFVSSEHKKFQDCQTNQAATYSALGGERTISATAESQASATPRPKRQKATNKKKVVAEMDSDDDLLWHLKLAKWTEKEIHQRFKAENRGDYQEKTIGTRFCRMKKMMKEHTDKALENGTAGWHEGDDEVLGEVVSKAESEIAKELAETEKKKWELVSEYMKNTKPVVNYSGKACRDRWDSLKQGVAELPLELRTDPTPEVLASIQKRKESGEKILQYEKDRPGS